MQKKLIRPKEGRILFGVAQGLGDYFEIDPVVVRILFVILTVWGGAGILLYIIGIFVIPGEENGAKKIDTSKTKEEVKKRVQAVAEEIKATSSKSDLRSGTTFGLIVLAIGLIFLFSNFFPWFSWNRFWPLLLVLVGIIILAGGRKEEK